MKRPSLPSKQPNANISKANENYLREAIRRAKLKKWCEDHDEFIAAYNVMVEKEGLPLDEWRSF